jgi:CRISPR system Cascade subunit CasC
MFISIHVIQSLPPSNPNRGREGEPKHAPLGGVVRAALSSQSQKHSARQWYHAAFEADPSGFAYRSREWHTQLAGQLGWAPDHQKENIARLILALLNSSPANLFANAIAMQNLIFMGIAEMQEIAVMSQSCSEALGELSDDFEAYKIWAASQKAPVEEPVVEDAAAEDAAAEDESTGKKKGKSKKAEFGRHPTPARLRPIIQCISGAMGSTVPGDIALFGRMMASSGFGSTDGTVEVATAIGVNALGRSKSDRGWVPGQVDFFSAGDDLALPNTSGAAMLGETLFAAPTLYRYANVTCHEAAKLIGDREAAAEAIKRFINGFLRALPTGHSRQFAHGVLPEFVLLEVLKTAPYGYSQAFLSPINGPDTSVPTEFGGLSISQQAVTALMRHRANSIALYGGTPERLAITALSTHWESEDVLPLDEASASVLAHPGVLEK